MFEGRYEHSFDEKGRLTIPVRYRELLVDGAYALSGFDRNLIVLPIERYNQIAERVSSLSIASGANRTLQRQVFSNAARLEFDKAGRILLPQHLRQFAGLSDQAILVGAGKYFEIWSPDHWYPQVVLLENPIDAGDGRQAVVDLCLQ